MNICLYSPYLPDHFGGGEKHFLNVANILAEKHHVLIAIPGHKYHAESLPKIQKEYEDFLGEPLRNIHFGPTPIGTSASFLQKIWWTKQFDCFYSVTDGSLFFSLASKNILHIQIPFTDQKTSVLDRVKLHNWQIKNTNSFFTKKIIEQNWRTQIDYVFQPMINIQVGDVKKVIRQKEKIILNVGRFFRQLHSKRQDILVNIFRHLVDQYPTEMNGWKLVLVGSVEDEVYAAEVKKQTTHYPIEIHHQVTHDELLDWYRRSAIYWHATGYGVDELAHPEKVEHFGISTVEGMAFGCVPIVVGKGGQVEAVGDTLQNLLWQNEVECETVTLRCINDKSLLEDYAVDAHFQAQHFGEKMFRQTLEKMVTT